MAEFMHVILGCEVQRQAYTSRYFSFTSFSHPTVAQSEHSGNAWNGRRTPSRTVLYVHFFPRASNQPTPPPPKAQNGLASALVRSPCHSTRKDGRSTTFGIPQWHCGPPVGSPLALSTCSKSLLCPKSCDTRESASVPKLTSHSKAWHEALRLLASSSYEYNAAQTFSAGRIFSSTHSHRGIAPGKRIALSLARAQRLIAC